MKVSTQCEHHKAKNWWCPDTVDNNGLMPLCMVWIGAMLCYKC